MEKVNHNYLFEGEKRLSKRSSCNYCILYAVHMRYILAHSNEQKSLTLVQSYKKILKPKSHTPTPSTHLNYTSFPFPHGVRTKFFTGVLNNSLGGTPLSSQDTVPHEPCSHGDKSTFPKENLQQ